ncbi:LysR family transcriptional regulator [Sphingomonas sp. UYEF23]|uniref:LysR family transcriptional regulator n=1 Tax=Sphingomonas sp. UYEF23 TaxID=1756408 RepID=UPI003397E8F9
MTLTPFDLNLRHLRALSAVVSNGSLSAAARVVSLSQSALTQGLGKLERQLDGRLFERHSDGVSATEAGMQMADRAAAAFEHLAASTRGAARGGRGFARPEHLMTATQLAAFLRLADAGSFVGAATASGLSQPALHRAVRDLEQICAAPLLERRGRNVVLTAAGRRIARGIRLAASEIAAGIVEVGAEVGGDQRPGGRIAIGAMPLSRALVLPRAIARFVREVPGTVIDVVEGSWRELIDPLRDGVIDVMIGALRDEDPPGFQQRPLFTDQLVVVGRAGHPLSGHVDPGLTALGDYGWIVAAPGTPLRLRWDALFANRVAPDVPIECGSVMVIRGILQDSDLLTLLSPDQVALEITAGMLTSIGPPLPHGTRIIGITTRTDWRPTAAQRSLIALIEQAAIDTRIQENK